MRIGPALVVLMGVFVMLSSTRYQLTSIHADAPCLGLGMLSLVLLSARRPLPVARVATAAVVVALATLAKPQGAFVAAAEALFLAPLYGVRVAAMFSVMYAASTLVLAYALPIALSSTFAEVWFNAVVVPSRHEVGFDPGRLILFLQPLAGFAAICLVASWLRRGVADGADRKPAARVAAGLWIVAIVLAPISFAGRSKLGGDVNSLHSHYYAAAATVLMAVDALAARRLVRVRALAFAAVLVALAPLDAVRNLRSLPRLSDNQHERVAAYLRGHDDTYFPWHSFSLLATRGRILHHADGIHARDLAGLPLSDAQFFRYAPSSPRHVAMPPVTRLLPPRFVYSRMVQRYYPIYLPGAGGNAELDALGMQTFTNSSARR
jgi:hypothetical protein